MLETFELFFYRILIRICFAEEGIGESGGHVSAAGAEIHVHWSAFIEKGSGNHGSWNVYIKVV